MFPANEMFTAAEVAYRQERAREAFGRRRPRRRIRLNQFPKVQSLTHLTHEAAHRLRAA